MITFLNYDNSTNRNEQLLSKATTRTRANSAIFIFFEYQLHRIAFSDVYYFGKVKKVYKANWKHDSKSCKRNAGIPLYRICLPGRQVSLKLIFELTVLDDN